MMNVILVGVGGALGSIARYGVSVAVARLSPANVSPYATTAVNLAGCLAIGVLAGLVASQRIALGPGARAFVIAGVLGGFTTFSSFGLETFLLTQGGRPGAAALSAAIQVVVGCALVAAGYGAAARIQ